MKFGFSRKSAPKAAPTPPASAPAPGLAVPSAKRGFPWKRTLVAAGLLGGAFALANLTDHSSPYPPPPEPAPVPETPPRAPEVKSVIAIVFDTTGKFYGSAASSYFLADREATTRCMTGLPANQQCYGVVGVDMSAGPVTNTCVGIGVDFLRNVTGTDVYTTGKVAEYLIVTDPTPEGTRAKLAEARPTRPNQFALGIGVFCNY